jgi:hypothetical protein
VGLAASGERFYQLFAKEEVVWRSSPIVEIRFCFGNLRFNDMVRFARKCGISLTFFFCRGEGLFLALVQIGDKKYAHVKKAA